MDQSQYAASPKPKPQGGNEKTPEKRGINRRFVYLGIIIVIAAIALILVYMNESSGANLIHYDNQLVTQPQMSALKRISGNNTLANMVGPGIVSPYPSHISSTNVTMVDGKPVVIYVGADFCPYCALTRWGMIIALMRFGNFTNLHYMTSSASDVFSNTPTFTFYNSTYTSSIIDFDEAEILTNVYPYQTLQQTNQLQNSAIANYDPGESIPFIDFGNKSVQIGVPPSISPGFIRGKNWGQIITNISDANSTISQAILGQANIFTAEICAIDNYTPQNVCSQPYVSKILGS